MTRLGFVGDISFSREIEKIASEKGYDFFFLDTITELINSDVLVGNLECVLTSQTVPVGFQAPKKV